MLVKKITIQNLIIKKKILDERMKFIGGMQNKKSISKLMAEYKSITKRLEGIDISVLPCRFCNKSYPTLAGLRNHERAHQEHGDVVKKFRKEYVIYCKKHKIPVKSDYVIKRTLNEMFGVSEGNKEDKGVYTGTWEGIKWKIDKIGGHSPKSTLI